MHRLRSLAGSLLSLHIPSSQITSADVDENAFIPKSREPVDELSVIRNSSPENPKPETCRSLSAAVCPAAKENLR
jgi:hypothetical protein